MKLLTKWRRRILATCAPAGLVGGLAAELLARALGMLQLSWSQTVIDGVAFVALGEALIFFAFFLAWRAADWSRDELGDDDEIAPELVARVDTLCDQILAEPLLPLGNAWAAQQDELNEKESALLREVLSLLPVQIRRRIEQAVTHHALLELGLTNEKPRKRRKGTDADNS